VARNNSPSVLNIPNALTCLRLFLAVPFIWLVSYEGVISSYLALLVFCVAALTDWLDGYLAKRLNQKTPFGIFMDPFADKVLVLSALLVFMWLNLASLWIVLVIMAREFIITSLRILSETRGATIGAMPSGKHKMVSQLSAIISILAIVCAQYTLTALTGLPWDTALSRMGSQGVFWARVISLAPNTLLFIAMIFSVVSGIEFIRKHRNLFLKL